MTHSVSLIDYLVIILYVLGTTAFGAWFVRRSGNMEGFTLAGKDWPEVQDVLRKRYERVLKRVEQVSSDDVFELFMNAIL